MSYAAERGSPAVLHDVADIFILGAPFDQAQPSGDGGQEIVEVMRDARSKLPQRLQLLRLHLRGLRRLAA